MATKKAQTQKKVAISVETTEPPQVQNKEVEETLESKALKTKKDWNVEKLFYCNGRFFAKEAEAVKEGKKGFAYYIF